MTEYVWNSPGGAYVVPPEWRRRFLSEFPGYRVRWSLAKSRWDIEQSYGMGIIPPFKIDPADDDLVRARDGFWLVMSIQPGDRMPCPGIITTRPLQRCLNQLTLRHRRPGEAVCKVCRRAGRDGRTIATYWPFDETLLEHLRKGNPLTRGIVKHEGKTQTWAALESDKANKLMEKEGERRIKERTHSMDAVDYRWISGIASSTGRTRKTIDERDLE